MNDVAKIKITVHVRAYLVFGYYEALKYRMATRQQFQNRRRP